MPPVSHCHGRRRNSGSIRSHGRDSCEKSYSRFRISSCTGSIGRKGMNALATSTLNETLIRRFRIGGRMQWAQRETHGSDSVTAGFRPVNTAAGQTHADVSWPSTTDHDRRGPVPDGATPVVARSTRQTCVVRNMVVLPAGGRLRACGLRQPLLRRGDQGSTAPAGARQDLTPRSSVIEDAGRGRPEEQPTYTRTP